MCVLRGPSLIVEVANEAYRQLTGERELVGLTVREAFPEVVGQGYFELLKRVYETGEPWIGRDAEDIRWAFPDHALILSLGCESAMNLPVRWQGRTLGTLNLLHRAGWYDEADAATGRIFAALAVPALLAARLPG